MSTISSNICIKIAKCCAIVIYHLLLIWSPTIEPHINSKPSTLLMQVNLELLKRLQGPGPNLAACVLCAALMHDDSIPYIDIHITFHNDYQSGAH